MSWSSFAKGKVLKYRGSLYYQLRPCTIKQENQSRRLKNNIFALYLHCLIPNQYAQVHDPCEISEVYLLWWEAWKKWFFSTKRSSWATVKIRIPRGAKKKQRKGGSEVSKNFFPNVWPPKLLKNWWEKTIALFDSFFDKEKDLMEFFLMKKIHHLKVQLARLKGAQNNKDLVTESFILH